MCIDIGEDNGGLILDVAEGGLYFQAISSLSDGEILKVRFKLPGTSMSIRTEAQFVRSDSSDKNGALKFLDVPLEVQMQIREWIALNDQPAPAPSSPKSALSHLVTVPHQTAGLSPSAADDGATRFNSVLSQALAMIAASADSAEKAATRSVAKVEKPAADLTATPASTTHRQSNKAAKPPVSGVADTTAEPPKTVAKPALPKITLSETSLLPLPQPKQPRPKQPVKKTRGSAFAAGAVVGCFVLATAGGGLVATGRLRLADLARWASERAPRIQNSEPADGTLPSKLADGGNSKHAVEEAASSVGSHLADGSVENNQSQAPSASNPPAEALPVVATVAPARPVRVAKAGNPPPTAGPRSDANRMPLGLRRPMPNAQLTTPQPDVLAPILSAGTAQPLPELGSQPAAAEPQAQPTGSVEPEAANGVPPSATNIVAERNPNTAAPSSFEPPKLLHFVEPVYPATARAAEMRGTVDVLATIGKDGVPRDLRVTSGNPGLAGAATDAVSQWRYRPAHRDGQVEESRISVSVNFGQ